MPLSFCKCSLNLCPPPDIDEINTIFHKLNKQPATLHVGYSLMIRTNSRACVERGHNNGRGRRNGKLHASRRTAHSLKTEWEAARVRAQTWYLCSRKAEEKKQQQTPPENIILIHTAQKQPLVFSFSFVVFFFHFFFRAISIHTRKREEGSTLKQIQPNIRCL